MAENSKIRGLNNYDDFAFNCFMKTKEILVTGT